VPAILLNGGVPVFVPLQVPSFRVDWEQVQAAITPRTRVIMLNSPHNPTGAVFTPSDLEALTTIITDTNILLISDEVYEHMVFDGQPHVSLLTQPELAARSFVISSFGKTYHATGWKVAYCIAPPAFTTEFRKIHQYLTFSTVTPIQHALADYLDNRDHYLGLPAFYQAKRDLFCELLRGSRFTYTPSAGTYFQLVSYEKITRESDQDFARRLTTQIGVAAIPVSVFYSKQTDHGLLRFCFAKTETTLRAAAEKLCLL
jgi:methionine aminotransferase